MTEFIEIHWTAGSIDEARRVCRYLVQERLVACAQIIPWIESVYMWDNQLETSQESKITLKTASELLSEVKEVILKNSSYDVPEITVLDIQDGNEDYLSWISESVSPALRQD